jgi:formate--tetrahydrofolate ligase
LRERLGRITFGYTYDRQPVTVADLGVQGALTLLLKEAIKPNLVQTIAGTPALVHGGPFANIAHGCNSLIATQTARSIADIVVTEAGFGADLGAEKYMDIKARMADVAPSAVVVVATVRALKMHGGVAKDQLTLPDLEALEAGVANLRRHVRNVEKFGVTRSWPSTNSLHDTPRSWTGCWRGARRGRPGRGGRCLGSRRRGRRR